MIIEPICKYVNVFLNFRCVLFKMIWKPIIGVFNECSTKEFIFWIYKDNKIIENKLTILVVLLPVKAIRNWTNKVRCKYLWDNLKFCNIAVEYLNLWDQSFDQSPIFNWLHFYSVLQCKGITEVCYILIWKPSK